MTNDSDNWSNLPVNITCCNLWSPPVDLEDSAVSELQPRYSAHSNWTVEAEFDFLDAASSHPLLRAFYVPWLSRRACKYNRYLLLARRGS